MATGPNIMFLECACGQMNIDKANEFRLTSSLVMSKRLVSAETVKQQQDRGCMFYNIP